MLSNKLMKRLSLYLFLILFSLQTPSQADDIRDLEIEGMSIGDSALDYYSESKIKTNKKNWYKNKKISITEIEINSEIYDAIQIHFWSNDKSYKIIGIDALIDFPNNIKNCYSKQKLISEDIKSIIKNAKKNSYKKKHAADKSGKSTNTSIDYEFKSGDFVNIACYDWSKKMGYIDNLRVSLVTKELDDWLYNEAYK